MSVRMPKDLARLSRSGQQATDLSTIEVEALSESASSLGHHGRKVEAALAVLSRAGPDSRAEAVAGASDAVWAYFVQRELCGLRDHRLIIREMNIPQDVLNRLGAVTKRM